MIIIKFLVYADGTDFNDARYAAKENSMQSHINGLAIYEYIYINEWPLIFIASVRLYAYTQYGNMRLKGYFRREFTFSLK